MASNEISKEPKTQIVNCNGSCFLCLTNCPKSESSSSAVGVPTRCVYPLEHLASFLPVDFKLETDDEVPVGVKLFVPLCDPCGSVVGRFNLLHQQLDNCLEEVFDVLKKSEGTAKKAMPGVMEKLRTQTLAKCDEKLRRSRPQQMEVSQAKSKPAPTPPPPPPIVVKASATPLSVSGPSAAATTSNANIYGRDDDNTRCPYCFTKAVTMKVHYIMMHPEHFFKDSRDPAVSPEQFRQIVVKGLFEKVLKADEGNCLLCEYETDIKSTYRRRNQLKTHLIAAHLQRLQKTVADLQRHRGSTLQVKVLPVDFQLPATALPQSSSSTYAQEDYYYSDEAAIEISSLAAPGEIQVSTPSLNLSHKKPKAKRRKLTGRQ